MWFLNDTGNWLSGWFLPCSRSYQLGVSRIVHLCAVGSGSKPPPGSKALVCLCCRILGVVTNSLFYFITQPKKVSLFSSIQCLESIVCHSQHLCQSLWLQITFQIQGIWAQIIPTQKWSQTKNVQKFVFNLGSTWKNVCNFWSNFLAVCHALSHGVIHFAWRCPICFNPLTF